MKSSPYPPRQPPIYPHFYKKILISPMTFENSQPPISNGSSHYGSRHFNLCPPGNLTYFPQILIITPLGRGKLILPR